MRRAALPSSPLPGPLDLGRTLLNFVDDNLLANVLQITEEVAGNILRICDDVLSGKGHHKSVGPTHRAKLLGPEFDVSEVKEGRILARIPESKKESCCKSWTQVYDKGGASLRDIRSLSGTLNWHRVICPQLGHVMPKIYAWQTAIQRIVQRQQKKEEQLMLSPRNVKKQVRMIATWYPSLLRSWDATNILWIAEKGSPRTRIDIFTDANTGKEGDPHQNGGIGFYSPNGDIYGSEELTAEILKMAFRDKTTSSTWLEWLCVAAAVLYLEESGKLKGARVVAKADSEPMMLGYTNGSAAPHMYPFLLIIVGACIRSSATLCIDWISRDNNKCADELARGVSIRELFASQFPTRVRLPINRVVSAYKHLMH